MLIVVALNVVAISSCSKDDDGNDSDSNGLSSSMIDATILQNHPWYRESSDISDNSVSQYFDRLYFVTDSKGAMTWNEKTVDTTDGDQSYHGVKYFSYVISGNYVTVTWEEDKTTTKYVYTNGNLVNTYGDTFTPQNLTSDTKSYIEELKANINNVYASVVGNSYQCYEICDYAHYTITFTSSTACTLKCKENVAQGLFTTISKNATYTMSSGVIHVNGVLPSADGHYGTIKTGSSCILDLHPYGGAYQDSFGNLWSKK